MTIGHNQLPGPGWKRGRHYIFGPNPPGTGIICEDINIAAALLCHAVTVVDNKVRKAFKPGKYAKAHPGSMTGRGEIIFVFEILGDYRELEERRKLFHGGFHHTSNKEFKENRDFLMDDMKVESRKAEKGQKGFFMKGSGNGNEEAEVQGAEGVRPAGGDAATGASGGADTDAQIDAGCSGEEAPGGDR